MSPKATLVGLAAATAVAGAALSATPAMAAPLSSCSYNPIGKSIVVQDHSGAHPLRVFRVGEQIRIDDGRTPAGQFCPGLNGQPVTGTVTNTDRIAIFASGADVVGNDDFIQVDQSAGAFAPGATPETDGHSEIEVQILVDNVGFGPQLRVDGTEDADEIRVGARNVVNLGLGSTPLSDQDVDITSVPAVRAVSLHGRGGNDLLSGNGNEASRNPLPTVGRVAYSGEQGEDLMVGGQGKDFMGGGPGNDRYFSADLTEDELFDNGSGSDLAEIDTHDLVNPDIEQRFVNSSVGRLKLTPTAIDARAGKPAHLKLAWKHPQAWKQLRSLTLRASDAGKPVATVTIDPARGRVSGRGAMEILNASKVRHHGKTVTADLRLRPGKRLAGRTLRLEVHATDAQGHKQLEPLAGSLTVAR